MAHCILSAELTKTHSFRLYFLDSGDFHSERRQCGVKTLNLKPPVRMRYVPGDNLSKDKGFLIGWVAYHDPYNCKFKYINLLLSGL